MQGSQLFRFGTYSKESQRVQDKMKDFIYHMSFQ